VAKAATSDFIQFDTYPGKMAPFNLTALGKAIAAFLDEDRLSPLLSQLSKGEGPGALPPGRKAFLAQLAEIRERGYAIEVEEERADISCVAAPFFDAEGGPAGAVGATGFKRDLVGDLLDRTAKGLLGIADTISTRLGHHLR